MRRFFKQAIVAAIAATMFAASAEAADSDCLAWSAAAPVIAKNSLLPGNVVYQMVQERTGGQIIHASLCDEGGHFFYKLVVLGPKGDVSNVTVDALTGQP